MKRFKHKSQEPKKIEFTPMSGNDGFTLDYNEDAKRFDLRQKGVLEYSHVNSRACINVAQDRFGVTMVAPETVEKNDKKN